MKFKDGIEFEMPIDPLRNIIFVHIPKNAGTSIEKSLGIYPDKTNDKDCDRYMHCDGRQHYTIGEIFSELARTERMYDPSRSFAVLRNPIERFISHYKWTKDKQNTDDLEDFFIKKYLPSLPLYDVESRHRWPQVDFIYLNNEAYVKYIIIFDQLNYGIKIVEKELGISILSSLTHEKRSNDRSIIKPTEKITKLLEKIYNIDHEIYNKYKHKNYITLRNILSVYDKNFNNNNEQRNYFLDKTIIILMEEVNQGSLEYLYPLCIILYARRRLRKTFFYFYKLIQYNKKVYAYSWIMKVAMILSIGVLLPRQGIALYCVRKVIKLS